MTDNPLLQDHQWPPFDRITEDHVAPAVDRLLSTGRELMNRLGSLSPDTLSWVDFVEPLARHDERLANAWSPVSHLHAVKDSPSLREVYNAQLPKLSDYGTEVGQNAQLYERFVRLSARADLDDVQRKIISDAVRDFVLAGVALPEKDKVRYGQIARQLSELQSRFEQHVLDATMAWHRHFDGPEGLKGLPESALEQARELARSRQMEGYLVTLDFPSYFAVMSHADDRSLRQEVYTAYCTRASDEGPHAGRWDNSELMQQIIALRQEKARLLGFANYAELSLATKMAQSPQQVFDFLYDLAERSRPQAQQEYAELEQFAKEHDKLSKLEAWDIAYYSEKLRQERYAINQEALRPWFPLPKVLAGLFTLCEKLYGIRCRPLDGVATWHDDVQVFEVVDHQGQRIAGFYLDLYARPHKRGGAWMDECRNRVRWSDGQQQYPVAYLTCNFNPPVGDKPACLTHDDVVTLFHEFGHGLHHMLTEVDYPEVSGIRGVPWDAVELPSQFHENFCYSQEILPLISGHVSTGEPLPKSLAESLLKARNFQSAMAMVRQLEFALFDFHLHHDAPADKPCDIQQILDEVRRKVAVVQPPAFNRFQHAFTHVFSGGYAAGYYSYKWAEVLSSDAFSRFEEEGLLNPETGQAFRQHILARGGSEDPMVLFRRFRGRDPSIDPLLRHSGISG